MHRLSGMGKSRLGRTTEALREDMPFAKFIPSVLTLLGLCAGITSIRFALSGHWKAAVAAIVCAAIFDTLDGRVARLLRVNSAFGAQLDSLADLVNFGVAPSVLIYMWTLYQAHGAGWAVVLLFCACSAIRLARFNIESVDPDPAAAPAPHFTGLPTPAAACLIFLPMLLSFQFSDPLFRDPILSAGMIALTSCLMVSRVPTLSVKHVHIPRRLRPAIVASGGLLLGFAIIFPWSTLTTTLMVYLATIPVGAVTLGETPRLVRWRNRRRHHILVADDEDDDEDDDA
jgi:CDP-diacylglycerol---serine O-phosphatidyltransferase